MGDSEMKNSNGFIFEFYKNALDLDLNYPKVSKKEAQKRNLKYYWNGKKCVKGHVTFRYMTGNCYSCVRERSNSDRRRKMKDLKGEFICRQERIREEIELKNELKEVWE